MSPSEIIERELRRSMRDDARIAAMVILCEPGRIGEQPVYEFLMQIKCIRRETVKDWLDAARVNPLRPGGKLTSAQRRAVAAELTKFWKAGRS